MVYTANYSESIEEMDVYFKISPDKYQGDLNVVNLQETDNAVREKKSMQQHESPPAKIKKHSLHDVCLGSCYYDGKVLQSSKSSITLLILKSLLEEKKICSVVDNHWYNIQIKFPDEICGEGALMQMWKSADIFNSTNKKI